MSKKELREKYTAIRAEIPEETKKKWDDEFFHNLINSDIYKQSQTIYVFVSFNDEIDTHQLITHMISQGKNVKIPVTEAGNPDMRFTRLLDMDHLEVANFGILEPKEEHLDFENIKDSDLILVPGLVFDEDGYRVGYGGGFYDKFLSKIDYDPIKIGICYEIQIGENLPREHFDIPVDYICTDKKWRTVKDRM